MFNTCTLEGQSKPDIFISDSYTHKNYSYAHIALACGCQPIILLLNQFGARFCSTDKLLLLSVLLLLLKILYDKADWQSIADGLQLLERCICRTPGENIDAEHLWNQFHDCMQNLVYTHIPHKTARRCCNLPWMTTKLRRQIRTRNRLYQKAKLSGSKDAFNRFVTLKHSIQKDLRASYWRYINNLISPEDEGSQQQSQK